MRALFISLSLVLAGAQFDPVFADTTNWQGARLSAYLNSLNEQGMRIIYSTDLVTDDLILAVEPETDDPRGGLAALILPFGLAVDEGPSGSLLIVRAINGPDERAGKASAAVVGRPALPEIIVTSSLQRLEYTHATSQTYLDRELATRIPAAAEETVRITNRLPSTANGGISSRNHIRGGEANEVLFLFDGLRLYEPYHLKDFQSVATIVNSNAIGGLDYYAGAYPARYGDRMSGVMNIELREPAKRIETELALSFFNASVLSLGRVGETGQGDWLLAARRGNLDLIVDIVNPDLGSPDYQDYLAHFAWEFGPKARLTANFLVSNDKIRLNDTERGEQAAASYDNQVFWVKWNATWSDTLRSETLASVSDITNERFGDLDLPGIVAGSMDDSSEFRALEFRQDWTFMPSNAWMLRFGFDIKDLDAKYRFTSVKLVEPPFDGILDNEPVVALDEDLRPAGAQYGLYTELRWRPLSRMIVDLGLRLDQQNYTTASDDRQYSPRASVLYQVDDSTELRFGWGQFYQAQEINELQVSDGISDFFPAQRAEHFVLNLKRGFSPDIDVNLSVYRKSFRTIRPRFENVFDTLTLLPELQFDRVRVDATDAESLGAELTVARGGGADDIFWWFSYAWSEVEDSTDEGEIKRSWDQSHTVKAGLSWRWGSWDFSAAGEVHTGWPNTGLTGEIETAPDGSENLTLETSERNALRHSVFHTLDLRISREFDVRRGTLTGFLEVTNLYDRANPCCTEYSLSETDGSLVSREGHWLPLVPSLGVVWRF